MKTALTVSAIIALLALSVSVLWVAHSVHVMRSDLAATQESLCATVEDARADLAVTQAALVNVLDKRTGEVTAETRRLRRDVSRSLADLTKIREDLRPVLENAVSTERELAATLNAVNTATVDITATIDDLYPDIKAAVASATVTTTSAAQVSQEVRRVAPAVATDAQQTVKNVRRMTSWPMVLGKALLSIPVKLIKLF